MKNKQKEKIDWLNIFIWVFTGASIGILGTLIFHPQLTQPEVIYENCSDNLITFIDGIDWVGLKYETCLRDYPELINCSGNYKCVEKSNEDYCKETCAPEQSYYNLFTGTCQCYRDVEIRKYTVNTSNDTFNYAQPKMQ
jgi:hypothetical protein